MSDLISVIVPIYNVQDYLKKCIESIAKQTYTNLEIILVNDGSTDNSEEICLRFMKQDDRIKYYTKSNGGLADARNFGLEQANGKYIAFVDSDDYIKPDMIETMYVNIIKHHADISEIDFCLVDENGYTKKKKSRKLSVFSRDEAVKAFLSGSSIENNVWCKLYSRDVIKDTIFPVNNRSMGEDLLFNLKVLNNVTRVVVDTREFYYYYVIRDTSLINQSFSMSNVDLISYLEEYPFALKNEFTEEYEAKLIREKVKCLNKMYSSKSLDDVFLPFLESYRKTVKAYPFNKARSFLSKKHLFTLFLMKFTPGLYVYLYKKFQKQ
ncbi:TPA: glycosyltransferase [Streptococcus suis]|nr:glycosyltransferase [Streptococcus suis]